MQGKVNVIHRWAEYEGGIVDKDERNNLIWE
ncbi:hypothetical protein CLOBOL_01889 [Enterocloster bolteae ATCC BAA-613]|uniref:Uncharacterized protein n=1 Tax=Enterocloster bolteae (strain ATCC BAA-613 / DSM 15670 / CCUG 46953 / JCM 12243 / WAL 16351) TaxID=411902 RepID=A8RMF2_ENTBW|nr:hypothetical protein CLOBOL_01889 [Enterocloster bolteae ATCC BAA-613]